MRLLIITPYWANVIHIDFTGAFAKDSQLKISYVSQDTPYLQGSLTDYARDHGVDESLFKAILRKLDFSRIQFEKDLSDYKRRPEEKSADCQKPQFVEHDREFCSNAATKIVEL